MLADPSAVCGAVDSALRLSEVITFGTDILSFPAAQPALPSAHVESETKQKFESGVQEHCTGLMAQGPSVELTCPAAGTWLLAGHSGAGPRHDSQSPSNRNFNNVILCLFKPILRGM